MDDRGPALAGTLDEVPLPALLRMLAATGKTGVVKVGDHLGEVALHEGRLTLAIAADGPNLEQVVIGSGLADSDSWDRHLAATAQGTTLVEALLETGADAEEVERILHDQVVDAVFELMLPSDETFTFHDGRAHVLGTRISHDVDQVLAEAHERVDAWRAIAEIIPSTALVMRLARDIDRPQITIDADEWHVLSQVDGRASIAEIIRSLGMSAFSVCAVLRRLVEAGAVGPVEP